MKLLALLDQTRKRVVIQDVELYFKKLNWVELGEFQKFSEKVEKDAEEDDTNRSIQRFGR